MNFEVLNKEFVFEHPLHRSTKNRVAFNFKGNADYIEKISTSCGCTGGTIEGDSIVVTYNSPDRTTDVLQKVTIWLKDGKPMEMINPINGQKMKNTDKKSIVLTIKGVVE